MMSGDVNRYNKKVFKKKSAIFFLRFKLLLDILETPPPIRPFFWLSLFSPLVCKLFGHFLSTPLFNLRVLVSTVQEHKMKPF